MRLLLAASEYPPGPGGIGTHAFQLAQRLGQHGWEVMVTARIEGMPEEEVRRFVAGHAVPLRPMRNLPSWPGRVLGNAGSEVAALLRHRPDVLLASGDRVVQMSALLAGVARVPWVAVEHGRIPPRWELPLKRRALRSADTVVCVSGYTESRLRQLGVEPRRSAVIGNGADEEVFVRYPEAEREAQRRAHPLGRGHLVATVGSVTARKGQETVVRALPLLVEAGLDPHYLCIGRAAEGERITGIARELGVAERVHLLGVLPTDEVVRLLNLVDVFAMTSRQTPDEFEGYGIAVVEAALCGLPAVVSSDSGLRDAVVDGETAIGVHSDDVPATAAALALLLGDPARRRAMAEAARERALAQQCWRHVAAEYDRVLRDVARA